MTENLKVFDLPQEEQNELITKAKDLGIKGFYTQMKVETLKTKIKEAEEANTKATETPEETPAADEQKEGADEQKPANDEQKEGEDEQKQPEVKEAPKAKEVRICHICRSKVIDGICQGCGFTLKK